MLQMASHTGLKIKSPFSDVSTLFPEVDYQSLMAQMRHQSHPRRKLKELQDKELLIRLKKGFYILSPDLIGQEHSPEIAANLLYGPSYLSLEFALSFYHLIPERVNHFTSVTSQKNKTFVTPIGHFKYHHLSKSLYSLGVTQKMIQLNRSYLIATPEKALMDMFSINFKNSSRPQKEDIRTVLEEDLRIDLTEFRKILNKELLKTMQPYYQGRRWNKLVINYLLENL